MEIFINGQLAVLKAGTSFEYIAENRLFSGSDSYTLSITFPLKDCAENIRIFGHIHRADVLARKAVFDCEIRHGSFFQFGTIVVNEISEVEVKCQFLEGRSETNFDTTFDDLYVNELDLGEWPTGKPSPSSAWAVDARTLGPVALPWVNDASGNIQNCAAYANGAYAWHEKCSALSWQPYLVRIVERVCAAVGYDCDLSPWLASDSLRYLLLCNTLPSAWEQRSFASALPHWSVTEFFERLELFLGCEFDVDHRGRRIDFRFTSQALADAPAMQLDNIVDEHTVEVSVEDARCEYLGCKNIVYKDCGHQMWPFYSCDWFIKSWAPLAERYPTLTALLAAARPYKEVVRTGRNSLADRLLYAEDVDMYFCFKAYKKTLERQSPSPWMANTYRHYMRLVPVNEFGGRIFDPSEDAAEEEVEFVPVRIDDTDDTYGSCMFLSFSGDTDDDDVGVSARGVDPSERAAEINATLGQPRIAQAIAAGERDKRGEYYDRVYVAWWNGSQPTDGLLPHPVVSSVAIANDMSGYAYTGCSLRLNAGAAVNASQVAEVTNTLPSIDPTQKATFKFLSDRIPNPRSTFLIHGKPYICEKITATFTAENGMSALLKGVFYPIEV